MALRDIIGQENALRILSGTLRRNRVPSALLLSGDSGIGKKLAAVNYAKAVNCFNPDGFDCCDNCLSCRKINERVHPDFTLLASEGDEIKIDDIRKIEEVLFMKPFEGRKKVVVIDDAEKMNVNAANAFLKTLEEPPPDSLILLVTSSPDGLPDTIRSRCMNIRFYPLHSKGLKKLLPENASVEDMRFSMGRPGIALSGGFAEERERFVKLLDSMLHGDTRDIWTDRNEMKSWIDMCLIFLRDGAVFKITGSESDMICSSWNPGLFRKADMPEIFEAYQRLGKMLGLLDFNLNKSISWNYASAVMSRCING